MALAEEHRKQLKEEGFCILNGVLGQDELKQVHAAIEKAIDLSEQFGIPTHIESLDPNASNVRLNNLPMFDQVFIDLLRHPTASALVEEVLGPDYLVSNFTGNIALPGSGSMNLHSDQALVVPPPWLEPWALNVIWVLNDAHEGNGATRYIPGSHRYQNFDEVPADALDNSRAFEAPAGSIIVMEGRMWHTSGCNTTEDEKRAQLFAYYSKDFIRQQIQWEATLPPEVKQGMDEATRALFGLGPMGNTRLGMALTEREGTSYRDSRT